MKNNIIHFPSETTLEDLICDCIAALQIDNTEALQFLIPEVSSMTSDPVIRLAMFSLCQYCIMPKNEREILAAMVMEDDTDD